MSILVYHTVFELQWHALQYIKKNIPFRCIIYSFIQFKEHYSASGNYDTLLEIINKLTGVHSSIKRGMYMQCFLVA